MKLMVFFQGETPEMRYAKEKAQDLETEGYSVEYFNWDDELTPAKAELYSIYQTPTYILTQDDGKLIQLWQGNLPPISEVKNLMGQ